MCEELILSGADIVKVGIAQVLFVQLVSKQASVIRNFLGNRMCRCCARSGRNDRQRWCCTTPGDVAKAFGGGADFVMLAACWRATKRAAVASLRRTAEIYAVLRHELRVCDETSRWRVAEYRAAEGKTVKLPLRGPVKIPRVIFWAACVQLVHTLGFTPERTDQAHHIYPCAGTRNRIFNNL